MACKDKGKKKKLVPVFLKSPVWLSFSMLMHTPNFTQNESSHWLSPLSFATGWLHSSSLTHWMSLCLARCSRLSSTQVSLQPAGDPLTNPDFREGYPVESFFPHPSWNAGLGVNTTGHSSSLAWQDWNHSWQMFLQSTSEIFWRWTAV